MRKLSPSLGSLAGCSSWCQLRGPSRHRPMRPASWSSTSEGIPGARTPGARRSRVVSRRSTSSRSQVSCWWSAAVDPLARLPTAAIWRKCAQHDRQSPEGCVRPPRVLPEIARCSPTSSMACTTPCVTSEMTEQARDAGAPHEAVRGAQRDVRARGRWWTSRFTGGDRVFLVAPAVESTSCKRDAWNGRVRPRVGAR